MTAIATDGDIAALARQQRRAEVPARLRAVGLVLPLVAFIVVSFVLPILLLLWKAGDNPEVRSVLPGTMAALAHWDGAAVPDEPVFAALASDLKRAAEARTAPYAGKRLNYEKSGMRSLLQSGSRLAAALAQGPYKPAFLAANPAWGDVATWRVIARGRDLVTPYYLLTALDLRQDESGSIVQVPADQRIFLPVLLRTLWIAFLVTLATLVLGYPVAYLLAVAPPAVAQSLMILVLLPFWTSLLVRTTAWVVLLQSNGVINDLLQVLHIFDAPQQLIFSRFGTVTAMTHIQLPFTILPIYSVMKGIQPSQLRAALSLGAPPLSAYWRVYVPQTMPGIAAGCLITFILSLGYYITPALVGGATDQMVANFVANYVNRDLNWGQAAALSMILLAVTLALYAVFARLVGSDRLRMG
jgi:putative spermidine/putrescine transport system permease protein